MELPLQVVEDLAPDQSSLSAAKKLLSISNWPMLGQSDTHHSIWGQCKGSGANPYLTMADVVDHGYKCTCPSRKFPCKHVLALLWLYSQNSTSFAQAEPTEWVMEWLARRRRPAGDAAKVVETINRKNIADIDQDQAEPIEDAEALQRKQAQQQQRAAQTALSTQQALLDGLQELDLWIHDQLRTGILAFNKELRERTRRIASRMVDAKATTLASRIDELASVVRDVPTERQPELIVQELGCWLLLSRAFQNNPLDLDAKRALCGAESRATSPHNDLKSFHRQGRWLCIGEQITNRRDGLISHSTYLWPLDAQPVADLHSAVLLQDFYPASTGKRHGSMRAGTILQATVQFYPSRWLQRATLDDFQPLDEPLDSAGISCGIDISQTFISARQQLPWLEHVTGLVGPCQLFKEAAGPYWLKTNAGLLPLSQHSFPAAAGGPLSNACVRWNGREAELLTAFSATWGVIAC